jgi:hypothetical protein
MAFLEINPRYRDLMAQHALDSAEDFLDLPAEIISGHPDRHVGRVTLGTGASRTVAFLKREHRIAWKDRLASATAGFGFVCKSYREALTLRSLAKAGIGCPEWIAVGQDRRGRAFLLVEQLAGAKDLRSYLHERQTASVAERHHFATILGEALANLHDLGFDQPDLYAKHILVEVEGQTIHFLDWQRSPRRRFIPRRRRCANLAALSATLADNLMTTRERLICLRAYLRHPDSRRTRWDLRKSASCIYGLEKRLLRKPHIQEQRLPPLAPAAQSLLWKDGEALCLTVDFQRALAGQIPDFLLLDNLPAQPHNLLLRTTVELPDNRPGLLVRRRQKVGLLELWARFRRRPLSTPEVRQACNLFRLERCGIRTPRLLAFGQRQTARGTIESFLLTELQQDVDHD